MSAATPGGGVLPGGLLENSVTVRVPATSANLGPGFDALGLALDLSDRVTARVTGSGLQIDVRGEAAADVPRDEGHLVVRAMRRTFETMGVAQPGLALHCDNSIPHGRGLGSSAAAIVSGVLAARALAVDGEHALPDDAVLRLAGQIEGHPDNVAPCLLGGLTIAWIADAQAVALRLDVHPDVRAVTLVPPFTASTSVARGLLPTTVPHADAAFAAGRAALLVAALTAAPQALLAATEDRLHQSYREPAMPESMRLVSELRGDGLAAVISGAGPSVLVLCGSDAGADAVARRLPRGWRLGPAALDPSGAEVGPSR